MSQIALAEFVQPVDVLVEAEDLAAVDADAFEDAVAVEQAVVVDADLGVFLRNELAVDVDLSRHAFKDATEPSAEIHGGDGERIESLYGSLRD